LLGSFPNPLDFPLTAYNTAQGDFAKVLREIFQKVFLISYYGKVSKMPNMNKRKTPQFATFQSFIAVAYNVFPILP